MRHRLLIAVVSLLLGMPVCAQRLGLDDFLEVAGHVRAPRAQPVENALVIAFSLTDQLNLRAVSGRNGQFELPPLPVGVYRVVAAKRGFLPALATITPTRKAHDVTLDLAELSSATEAQKADAWTLRRSLPRDVLRDIDAILGTPTDEDPNARDAARFAGSMESVAGYSSNARSLERTSVAFRGDVGDWGVEFSGRRQLIDQPVVFSGGEQAEAADVSLEVRSSPDNTYRVTSTRASWQQPAATYGEGAGVATHSIAWHGRLTNVQLRYLSHENLFVGPEVGDDDTIELAGDATLFNGRRSNLGVSITLKQDSVQTRQAIEALQKRYADLATRGRFVVSDGLGVEYGVITRIGDQIEFMPQSAAAFRLGESTSIQVAGAYKLNASDDDYTYAPRIARVGQFPTMETRYKYSVTLSSELGDRAGITASARRAAADALTFLLFDDRFDEFWDGVYLHKGEVLTDGVLSIQAGIGPSLEIAMITSAGRVETSDRGLEDKLYLAGEVKTHYEPTGTSLDISYRVLEQPDLVDEETLREIERLSIVVGQSLHLPVDVRVLLGFSLANENETLAAVSETTRSQKRLMGGLSFSF